MFAMGNRQKRLWFLCLCLLCITVQARTIWYVDCSYMADGSGDLTLDEASPGKGLLTSISDALAMIGAADEIRVAQGFYRERIRIDSKNVILRGGYAGRGAADPSARDIRLYETVISGDYRQDDVHGLFRNNTYCVMIERMYDNVVLDGLTIADGYRYGEFYDIAGSALHVSGHGNHLIVDCTFRNNRGTAAVQHVGWSQLEVRYIRCRFIDNQVNDTPAAVFNKSCTAIFEDCLFSANRSTDVYTSAGVMDNDTRVLEGENIQFDYSTIQGGYPGVGNLDVDPQFARPGYWDTNDTPDDLNDDSWVEGDYHLKSQGGRWDVSSDAWIYDDTTSPCIDAGDPNHPVGWEPFPNGGILNIGAYGGTDEASKSWFDAEPCTTVMAGDINGDCRVDEADLALLQSHWLWVYTPPVEPNEPPSR
jgi:hypothetical protein